MLRRLFYLFPDEPHAQRVVDKLVDLGIAEQKIHAIAEGVELKTLPEATERQKQDTAFRVEKFIWTANLALFAIALPVLAASLVAGEYYWAIAALLVMVATFIAGEQFAVHVPDVHLTEFSDALSHGEILLMVDVPFRRVVEIDDLVRHNYPDAVPGGVSWAVDAFGL
jgi:hypothetical protein